MADFGGVYEHSPWVAEAIFDAGLSSAELSADVLARQMAAVVESAGEARQLALLRAHPELAGKLAVAGNLTDSSRQEQQGAALDKCTPDEFARFQALNAGYGLRFGFPFIIAVRGLSRTEVLQAFEARIANTKESELRTALEQVHKIARLRLQARADEAGVIRPRP